MSNNEYHPFSKFLHWAIVFIILVQFFNADFVEEGGVGVEAFLANSHLWFGLLVLPLSLALLFMRFYQPGTRTDAEAEGVARYAALGMQYFLYTLMFIIPLTGWVLVNSNGVTLDFFGLFNVPNIVAEGSALGEAVGDVHEGVAWFIAFLVIGHAGMALFHHFIVKDDALKRMLPRFLMKR